MLGSKEIYTVNKTDSYDAYKNLYLSEKEREEKLLLCIQPAKGWKAQVGVKKANGASVTVMPPRKCN